MTFIDLASLGCGKYEDFFPKTLISNTVRQIKSSHGNFNHVCRACWSFHQYSRQLIVFKSRVKGFQSSSFLYFCEPSAALYIYKLLFRKTLGFTTNKKYNYKENNNSVNFGAINQHVLSFFLEGFQYEDIIRGTC